MSNLLYMDIDDSSLPDPAAPLIATGNLRRRELVDRLFVGTASAAALLAVGVLGILIYSVIKNGASVLSIDFLTKAPPAFGAGGGIAPQIVGTALIVAAATVMAMPVGILVGIYLTEFAERRTARVIRLALDLLNGLPTIVVALFIFGLLVVGHGQKGIYGSIALAIIMLPLIARASQEVLLLVPQTLRDAADALGVTRRRTVLGVVLPAALGGIITGTILAVARAAGETAPVLLLTSIAANQVNLNLTKAMPNIPVYIFNASEQADPQGFARAWGAALVLLAVILVSNIGARALFARSKAKIGQ